MGTESKLIWGGGTSVAGLGMTLTVNFALLLGEGESVGVACTPTSDDVLDWGCTSMSCDSAYIGGSDSGEVIDGDKGVGDASREVEAEGEELTEVGGTLFNG